MSSTTPPADPAAPAQPLDAFPWYVEHSAPVLFGARWSTNGYVALRDVAPCAETPAPRSGTSSVEAIFANASERPAVVARANGYAIVDDEHVYAAHYLDLAEAVSPAIEWRVSPGAGSDTSPLVGFVADRPAAVVMAMRLTPQEAREGSPGYPPCQVCGGDGKNKDCPECDGSGEAECVHCGHEAECENCDGKGRLGRCARCHGSGKAKPAEVSS